MNKGLFFKNIGTILLYAFTVRLKQVVAEE